MATAASSPNAMQKQASGRSILWGILLILAGIFAISLPFVAAAVINLIVAWAILVAGITHIMLAFTAHGTSERIWKVLVGLAYLFLGTYLFWHPVLGVAALTLMLAALFLVEAAFDTALYFRMRHKKGSGWVLLDALSTLIIALLIYVHWPSSTVWAIGTLVGVSLIMSGATRIALSTSLRSAARPV
jgi:uncharacterized membrane protein HdeD (DUF308 family)